MKTLRAIGGLPVICEGTRVGRVLSVQLTPDMRRLSGLHVDLGLRGRRFLPEDKVRVLGDVAVLAEDGFAPEKRGGPALLPARALPPAGARLGCITGAWLDERTHEVAALELSGGYWEDLFSGRTAVRFYHVRRGGGIVICGEGGEEE